MLHAEATTELPVDADRLWASIGSFQGIAEWHPMLCQVEGTGESPGSTRTATGRDGAQQTERLREVDPIRRQYRYTMESTALPVTDYLGELRVGDAGDGTSTVRWTADFSATDDPDQTLSVVQGFLDAGLQQLTRRHS